MLVKVITLLGCLCNRLFLQLDHFSRYRISQEPVVVITGYVYVKIPLLLGLWLEKKNGVVLWRIIVTCFNLQFINSHDTEELLMQLLPYCFFGQHAYFV